MMRVLTAREEKGIQKQGMKNPVITTFVSFIPPCSQWNGYFDGFQFAHGADESLSLGDASLWLVWVSVEDVGIVCERDEWIFDGVRNERAK